MAKPFDELEQTMQQLYEEHERLLALVRRKQQAMRLAQPAVVEDCCQRENHHVQRIGEIEQHRQQVVGRLTESVEASARAPMTLTQLAEHATEPQRGRLLVMQQKLRDLMGTIQRENETAQRVTDGLLRHVQGMLRQVTQMIDGAGVYGRRGPQQGPTAAVSSFSATG